MPRAPTNSGSIGSGCASVDPASSTAPQVPSVPSVQPPPPIPTALTEQGDADAHRQTHSRPSIADDASEETNASQMANIYMNARVAAVSGDGEVALGLLPQTPSCRMSQMPAGDQARASKRRSDCNPLEPSTCGAPRFPTVRVHVNQAKIAAMIAAAPDDEDRPERVGVVMWMVSASGEPLGPVAEWPARKGLSPLWNSARSVVQNAASSDGSPARLRIELWGVMDDSSKWLLAGPVEFPSAKLPTRPTSIAMHRWDPTQAAKTATKMQFVVKNTVPPANIALHALLPLGGLPFVPKRMTVFFVRHGESRWNAAKRGHNVYKMVREHDHPLNEQGYRQALGLQQVLAYVMSSSRSSTIGSTDGAFSALTPAAQQAVQQMASAGACWASPLTRAVQTAIVALSPVLEQGKRTLELKTNVREKKNFGGLDSIGRVCGAECYMRALRELRNLDAADGGPALADVQSISNLSVDTVEVEEEWWTASASAEDSKSLDERLQELLHQLEHASSDRIIVVGHSHYYQALFKRFLHPSFFQRDAALARMLQTKSVPNCAVVKCELDFSLRPHVMRTVELFNVPPPNDTASSSYPSPGSMRASSGRSREGAQMAAVGSQVSTGTPRGTARQFASIEARRPLGTSHATASGVRNGVLNFLKGNSRV